MNAVIQEMIDLGMEVTAIDHVIEIREQADLEQFLLEMRASANPEVRAIANKMRLAREMPKKKKIVKKEKPFTICKDGSLYNKKQAEKLNQIADICNGDDEKIEEMLSRHYSEDPHYGSIDAGYMRLAKAIGFDIE